MSDNHDLQEIILRQILRNKEQEQIIFSLEQQLLHKDKCLEDKDTVIHEKDTVIHDLTQKLNLKDHMLKILQKILFGQKSEKVRPGDSDQLSLGEIFDSINQAAEEALSDIDKIEQEQRLKDLENDEKDKKPGKKRGKKRLSENLPRVRVEYSLTEEERICSKCAKLMPKIREEVVEKLAVIPIQFVVLQIIRDVYGCDCRECIKTAPAPATLIEQGNCDESMLAHVITQKYDDHLPLYRLERIFSRSGLEIASSTMVSWISHVARHIEPIVEYMKKELLKSPCINTDDTPLPVIVNTADIKKGKVHKGYMWVYQAEREMVIFRYTDTRAGEHARKFLEGYNGYLQCDGYRGYDRLFKKNPNIVEVNCWAHVRRKFKEAGTGEKEKSDIAVNMINMLYKVEHIADSKQLKPNTRLFLRKEISVPILKEFKVWLEKTIQEILPRSPLADAIDYTINQWPGLVRFLEDGNLRLDNNIAELSERHTAIGRGNWMFCGSVEGAHRMALIYSLVYTCRLHKINTFEYFTDILKKIAGGHPQSRIEELTPQGWKKIRDEQSGKKESGAAPAENN